MNELTLWQSTFFQLLDAKNRREDITIDQVIEETTKVCDNYIQRFPQMVGDGKPKKDVE
jgi:hypothetical protein